MFAPMVDRIQPAVPSPPQHRTRKSGICEKYFNPGRGPPFVKSNTCLGLSKYRNLFSILRANITAMLIHVKDEIYCRTLQKLLTNRNVKKSEVFCFLRGRKRPVVWNVLKRKSELQKKIYFIKRWNLMVFSQTTDWCKYL